MMRLFGKKKWLAFIMVIIMVFTLLPVDLNWADAAAMLNSEESLDVVSGDVISTKVNTTTGDATTENVPEGSGVDGQSMSEEVYVDETTTEFIVTETITSNAVPENNQSSIIVKDISQEKASYTINDKGSLGQYITDVQIQHSDQSSLVTSSNPANADDLIYIDYMFDLSQVELSPGDRYTITIPTEYCSLVSEADQPLIYEGVQIGTYDITSSGQVSITFNENITSKQGVCGEFWVGCQLSDEKIKEQDTIEIDVTDGHYPPVEVQIYQESKIPEIKKESYTNADGNIVWKITLTKHGADLNGTTITDKLQNNQSVVSTKVTAQKDWQSVNIDGTYSWDAAQETLTFNQDLDVDYVYVEIETDIPSSAMPDEDQSMDIPNTVDLTTDTGTYSADSKYTYKTDRISKSGSYDKTTGQTTWTITVNANKETLTNVSIADDFLTENTDYEMVGDITISPAHPTTGSSVTTFPIQFNSIDTTYTITFVTKKTDSSALNGTLSNDATITADDIGIVSSNIASVSNTIGDYVEKTGGYNWSTKKIDWTITVNKDHQTMTDAIIEDTIGEHHVFDSETFKVVETTNTNVVKTYTYPDVPGSITNVTEGGFTYTLPSSTTNKYVITYSTTIDASKLGENTSGKIFQNDVHFSLDEKPEGEDVTSTAQVWENMSLLRKVAGSYDYAKNEISWEIYVNENNTVIKNAVVNDIFGANQSFVDGSIEIYQWQTTTDQWGNAYDAYVKDDTLTASATGFPVTLGDIDTKYKIVYRSKVDDAALPLTATTTFDNTARLKTDSLELDKTASKEVEPLELKKTGSVTLNNVDYPEITWNIDINRNKKTLPAGVISDTLDMSLDLYEESVKLYVVDELNEDGTVKTVGSQVTTGWSYSYNPLTHYFEIILPANTSETYRLTYVTKVTDKSKSISNTANFKGESPTEESISSVDNLQSSLNGAVVTYKYATLKIKKVDAETGTVLEGAVFSLYDNDGNYLGDLDPTDENGETSFTGIIVGAARTYTIVEKEAPTGYVLGGFSKSFNATTEGEIIYYEVPNVKESTNGEIEIYKKDNSSPAQPVGGAQFGLWYGTNTSGDPVKTATTDSEGKAHFYDVTLGAAYTIKEISAPDGYEMTAETKTGTLTSDSKTAYYEFTNNREIGTLKVQKVDDAGIPLSGVTLALYKKGATEAEDTYITSKTTDGEGYIKFTELEYGTYYLLEPNAPDGYKITDASLLGRDNGIVINSTVEKTWTVKNITILSKVKIEKVDSADNTKGLAGAEFSLYSVDGSGNKVYITKVTTDSNGKAEFTDLPCGDYFLKETKAPEDYILSDSNEKAFTITGNEVTTADGTVEVDVDGTIIFNYTFTNVAENAKLEFNKVDNEGAALSEGVEFTLYDEYGMTVVATATPNASGLVSFENLTWGTYILRETQTPDKYNRYPDDIVITIDKNGTFGLPTNVSGDNTIVNTIKIPPYISFKFKKQDNAGNNLAGVVFAAYLDGTEVTTAISDANGVVFFQKVFVGNSVSTSKLVIKEKTPKAGYQELTSEIATINFSDFTNYTDPNNGIDLTMDTALDILSSNPVVNNPIIGRIELTKTQTDAAAVFVPGAVYGIYTDTSCSTAYNYNGGSTNLATTNNEGKLVFENIPYGVYYIKEITAPSGYQLDTTVYTVAVTKQYEADEEDTIAKLEVTDDKIYGTIALTKKDVASNALLSGAEFKLYTKDAGGNYTEVTDCTMTTNGAVHTFTGLEIDTAYYAKETKVPEGYTGAADYIGPLICESANNYAVAKDVTNTKQVGKVEIIKYKTGTTEALQGAEFTITYPDGTKKSVSTGSDGKATFENLPYLNSGQEYNIQETKAPNGYVEDQTIYTVTSEEFKIAVNSAGSGAIVKTITVYNQTSNAQIKIVKRDKDTAALLAGAEFSLYKYDDATGTYEATPIATAVTNSAGIATFNVAETGTTDAPIKYKAVETKSPEKYCLASNVYHVFNVMNTITEYSWDVVNTKVIAAIEVTKEDVDTAEKLEGAEFTLYDVNKVVLDKKTTGAEGYVRFNNLTAGNYWIQETKAPEGYDNNYTDETKTELIWYPVVIEDGSEGKIVLNNSKLNVVARNKKLPEGKITIQKKDSADGSALAGAEFTLYQSDGTTPVAGCTPVVTDAEGKASFDNLDYGSYIVKETKAPENYKTPTFWQAITINRATEQVEIEVENSLDEKVEEIVGTVSVLKVDSENNAKVLSGAEFTIYNAAGQPVKTMTTDVTGKASAVLPQGAYSMVETKAPEGYEAKETTFTFNITETEKEFSYTVDNDPVISASIKIYKIDDTEDENPLKGAEFTLYKDEKKVAKAKTNKKGIVIFENLPAGTYVIKETKAPKGYKKLDSAKKVTISKNKEYSYTFVNEKIETSTSTTSKKTGDGAPIVPLLGMMFLAMAGLGFLLHYKKRESTIE